MAFLIVMESLLRVLGCDALSLGSYETSRSTNPAIRLESSALVEEGAASGGRWQVNFARVTAVQKEVSVVISLNRVCSVRRTCTESV
jgi:hypothetical protein